MVFIAGCGYVGTRVAKRFKQSGDHVHALVCDSDSKQKLLRFGFRVQSCDLDKPDCLIPLSLNRCKLFYFVPPSKEGIADNRIREFLTAVTTVPSKIVFISTTGVYGDQAGGWVTEDSGVQPQTDRAKRRYDAEQVLRDWAESNNVEYVILRIPGIYGPNRLPLKRLRNLIPMPANEHCSFTNRIHVDDLVEICCAVMEHQTAKNIYNVSDGHPLKMRQYFELVAELTALPYPPFILPKEINTKLSQGLQSYLAESRCIDGTKVLHELNIQLHYSDPRRGVLASLKPD